MKQKYYSKKYYLLGLFLLSIFCLAGIVSITSGAGVVINTEPKLDDQHRGRLHSLFLGDAAALKVYSGSESLTISGGLIIGSGMNLIGEPSLVMIGGGENNNIGGKNSGIAGGERNTISDGNDSAIGGGSGNYVEGENAVVVGGSRNTAENRGIVVGGYSNTGVNGGIVLGGYKNYAEGNNSLVMGKNSTGLEGSFSWNANNSIKNSARIDVQSGVLIGTYGVKIGTRLVVSGAIKLGESKYDITGAIQLNNKGCLMMYDGSSRQVFGKLSEKNPECNQGYPCEFGNTIAQEGDIVTGYFNYYARDCRTIAQRVICRGGKFYSGDTSVEIYPYCYDISLDKSLDTNSKNTICKGLIPNAHRVNGYFKQRLEGGVWTPTSSPVPKYTSDSNVECSYRCNDGFSFRQDPARCTCDINIEYDCNEGKGGGSTVVEYGNRPTTLSKDACSREGYELVGWSWDKNAENPAVSPGAPIYSLVQCKNYTLYAVRKKSYTITYNCNGGEGNPEEQHVVCGEQTSTIKTGCTKENAIQTGWYYHSDGHLSATDVGLPYNYFPINGATIFSSKCQSFELYAEYETFEPYLKDGSTINQYMSELANGKENVRSFKMWNGSSMPSDVQIQNISNSGAPVYIWYSNGTIYYYTTAKKIYLNHDSSNMFKDCKNLTELDVSKWDTSKVTDMGYMFRGCSSLTELDVSKWDTSKVTDMRSMFYGCSSLTELDVSKWDTSKVTSMLFMFNGCSSLTELDVSKWDTSQVTSTSFMFYGCSRLTELDVSKWDTSQVTSMSFMFDGCSRLTELDVSKWNTSQVTSMSSMFYGCSRLTELDVSKWDTSKVTNMQYMFRGCSSLTELDVSKWDTSKVTNMQYMFYGCSSLTELDVSSWNTSQVTNMQYMFYGCRSLTELEVSKWNTSQVTNMQYMFYGCRSLTELEVSKWNTSQVTNMQYMFYGCSSLTELDVSKWNTSQVTNMQYMFYGCSSLTELDVSKWNTSQVTDMWSMFNGCSSLTELDLNSWDTSKVTDMGSMFYGCSSLTELDVSSWNTSQVNNMGGMFHGCNNLTELDLNSWDTSKVTDMGSMFYSCSSLTELDLNSWDTSKVTDMGSMFNGCSSLTELDVSKWNTSQVTDMGSMFDGCSSLTELDLSSWDTSQVIGMGGMFDRCNNLKTIYVSGGFVTPQISPSAIFHYNMFDGDTSLVGGNGTTYKGSSIIYAKIDRPGQPGYFTAK